MKKSIVLLNVLLMLGMVVFVSLYTRYERREVYRQQEEAFVSTSAAIERVTENYLEGEQNVCDVWARYLSSRPVTMEEAADIIRSSHVMPNASAHVLYADTRGGLSTRPALNTATDYAVSYQSLDLLDSLDWIGGLGESVNVTPAYTNPMNGEASLAFCNRIPLRTEDGGTREGLLLRVVPVADLEEKWIFPQESHQRAEYSIIDAEGSFIIRGGAFSGTSFYDYYEACNPGDGAARARLTEEVRAETGVLTMKDAGGRDCLIVHTPIVSSGGWILLSYIPSEDLFPGGQNWLLIGGISGLLLLLFLIDLASMQVFNRKLQLAATEAAAANKAKTDFLSTMSHDIRTPMNAIIGLTTLAEHNIGDTDSVRENLRKIGLASNHLLTLINDILDISKVESGKLTLSPRSFSIVETVENLVNLSHPMIREKNIDFSFRINRMEKEYLYADQLRLNQIYINLLSNAIKYTEPGGRVSVDMREEPSDRPGCIRLRYTVSDTGVGMSPEFMTRMYQPFSRQTDSRVNSVQGTGLGLAITKQMVDLMHGSIDCQSESGKGTTFTVVLDLPAAERQREDLTLEPMDVLLVDDDPVLLETAVDTLASLGASAEAASSGAEALGMIERRHRERRDYRIVILDWKLPGMDGVETLRRIRSEVDPKLPILLISAYEWSEIEEEARAAGANGFISKPLFRSTLYDKISEILGMESHAAEPEDDYSDLAGLRVLVAEDNDVNWEIISAMLSLFGIESERAENGRLCVERMQKADKDSFLLIFMDIQMPEMNGLDATRAIRALPDPSVAAVPIIAMTADAFSENVSACLEAGMNGHIAKPVDIKLVVKEIRRVIEMKAKYTMKNE